MNIESIQAPAIPARAPAPEPANRPTQAQVAAPRQAAHNEAAAQANATQADPKALKVAVEHLSDFVSTFRPEINFTVDEASGVQVVKIVDSQSKMVIRQIPSEEAIQIAQALDKLQGLFVTDQA